jgi:hypothetical protein
MLIFLVFAIPSRQRALLSWSCPDLQIARHASCYHFRLGQDLYQCELFKLTKVELRMSTSINRSWVVKLTE